MHSYRCQKEKDGYAHVEVTRPPRVGPDARNLIVQVGREIGADTVLEGEMIAKPAPIVVCAYEDASACHIEAGFKLYVHMWVSQAEGT